MTKDELKAKHKTYEAHIKRWNFWQAAYDGGEDFIDEVIYQHPRESGVNWQQRKDDACVFNYATSIIDLFNFYLTEKSAIRNLGRLADDTLWQMFYKDCDLYNTNFDIRMNELQKLSSIYGMVGILVDKAQGDTNTVQEAKELGIYPYLATYTPPNILDWIIERDPVTNRPVLTYLKLMENDETYKLWYPTHWEHWEIPTNEDGSEDEPQKIDERDHELGEIPFLWMLNVKSSKDPYFGISDIKEIARITASITRNISYGEEVIKFAGFPIFRVPMEMEGGPSNPNTVGVRAVQEFDPENPEAKPDWLESEVDEPITAILTWIDKKVDEIFQTAHLSGIHATEKSREARSGVALRYEFQQLGSVLCKKNDNLSEAELGVLRLWLKWQKQESWFPSIEVRRSKEFSLDDLSQSLDNLRKASKEVYSKHFKKLAQQKMVQDALPDIGDDDFEKVIQEIDTEVNRMPLDFGLRQANPQRDVDSPDFDSELNANRQDTGNE